MKENKILNYLKLKRKRIIFSVLSIVFFILLAYLISWKSNSEIIAPSPTLIFKKFIELFKTSSFYKAMLFTLLRALAGFVISFIPALLCAVIAYKIESFESFLYPLVVIIRAMPTIAVIYICLLWLKSDFSPLAVSFLVLFPMLYSSSYAVLKSSDYKLKEMVKVYGIKRKDVFFKMTLPQTFTALFPITLSTFSFNVKLTVAGESLAGTKYSLGKLITNANANIDAGKLFALTLVAILLGFLVELILSGTVKIIGGIINEYKYKKLKEILR